MIIYRLSNKFGLFFLLLPIVALIIYILSRFLIKKGVRITGVSQFHSNFSLRVGGYYLTLFLMFFGLLLIAFSLTKPQRGIKKERIITEGIDIMFSLDTSASMLTKDFFEQSRITAAKSYIQKFISMRKGDRIGLITFSDSSVIKCPATTNYTILDAVISRIKINPHEPSATAIGVGLASAINRILKIKGDASVESEIVILVTDGINNTGEISPETAIKIAEETGIKVYTVGIGKQNEIDMDLLQSIADRTGGIFFHSRTSGELGEIFERINELEKRQIETVDFTRFNDIGYQFAFSGLVLFFISFLFHTLFFRRIS